MVAGDFNGDKKIDIAELSDTYKEVAMFLGNGDGTLHGAPELSLPTDWFATDLQLENVLKATASPTVIWYCSMRQQHRYRSSQSERRQGKLQLRHLAARRDSQRRESGSACAGGLQRRWPTRPGNYRECRRAVGRPLEG